MITPPLQLDDPSTPGKRLKKKEKKDLKRIERAANRAKIVTQADIEELGQIMYPTGIGGEGTVDSLLSDALSKKFQPSVFSEVGLMEKLILPSGTAPNHTQEVKRVLAELAIQKSTTADKEEVKLWNAIRARLREDMEINWNGSVQMKRRRIIYAQWVSQGALDAMAQWAEDWDVGTGWKIDGGFKVETLARSEDLSEPEGNAVLGTDESSEGEDVDGDDASTVTSSLSGLSIGASRPHSSGLRKHLPPPINANIQMIKDDRRGGSPVVERMVKIPLKSYFGMSPGIESAPLSPFRPIFVASDPEAIPSKLPPILRIVPDRGMPSYSMTKEIVTDTVPMSKAWNDVAADNRQKRKAEASAASPPPSRVLKITAPLEQEEDNDDDGDAWIPVGKKGKAK